MTPPKNVRQTPEWSHNITQFIEKALDVPFDRLTVTLLAGDASARRYWRLTHQGKHWVLLETEPFEEKGAAYPYINVQKHLAAHQVHVPKIYDNHPGLGMLLIEDFGDNLLVKAVKHLSPKKYAKYYFLALDELFKIHFDASKTNDACIAFSLSFDVEKLTWELNHTQTFLFEKYLKTSLKPNDQNCLTAFFQKIVTHLANQPRVFTHRDYHSRNIILVKGKIGVLDFQDARMGACQYDLASLLQDSYLKLPEPLIHELLDYYIFEKEKREKVKINREEFQRTFDWMALQRNLKAMGTFAYLHLEKKKSDYLKFILPTYAYVNENFKKYPEFKEVHHLIGSLMETFK